jgi:8-oxo-dGTP pyrophosphatase MutT (NUDIX family)
MELVPGGKPSLIPTQCAGAVVMLGRFIVLVRPINGRDEWILPKGHIEGLETALEAAKREAQEETGAVVSIEDPMPIKQTTYEDLQHNELKTTSWFVARAAALKTELAEGVGGQGLKRPIGIFPPLVAIARLTYQDHRDVLVTVLTGGVE